MKKFTAIVLLIVHLFYIGGYTFIFEYLSNKSDIQMVKNIENNKIDTAELIEIKIPTHLPYFTDWSDYRMIKGQVQLQGTFYNYVKIKMSRDTLFLKCIPNSVKTNLSQAHLRVSELLNDSPGNKKKAPGSLVKKNIFGTEFTFNLVNIPCLQFFDNTLPTFYYHTLFISSPFIKSRSKPPNRIS